MNTALRADVGRMCPIETPMRVNPFFIDVVQPEAMPEAMVGIGAPAETTSLRADVGGMCPIETQMSGAMPEGYGGDPRAGQDPGACADSQDHIDRGQDAPKEFQNS